MVNKKKYVMQFHKSKRPHYDFRLEVDGVAKSWAIPKKPEFKKGEKRLAVQVEDHSIDYMSFEGKIPQGQYGAGTVKIWDSGFYEPVKISEKEWIIDIKGKKLKGEFVLVKFRDKNWLMFRKKEG